MAMTDSPYNEKMYKAQQQSQSNWARAGRWGLATVFVVGVWMMTLQDGRFQLPAISTNAFKGDACMYQAHPPELMLDLEGFDWGKARETGFIGGGYVTQRLNLRYYRSIVRIAEQYAPEAKSIIDVGAPWPFVTAFTWIANKTMLNNRYPEGYKAPNAVSQLIETDFYEFNPPQKYDVVICNQVLEHVPEPEKFAQKLLEIGNVVIVSVPFKWPPGPKGHIQHHIDQERVIGWFGNAPWAEMGVITEKGKDTNTGRRLYVVFDQTQGDVELDTRLAYGNRKLLL